MNEKTQRGLDRLNQRLPLALRQAQLPGPLRRLHRAILRGFGERGEPPTQGELGAWVEALDAALERLAADDLIVRDGAGRVVGAYPMTREATNHRVELLGHSVNAMCAVDALAVSCMFGVETRIDSRCRVSGEPIVVRQLERSLLEVVPLGVQVGIRWQAPGSCAAHTLCREMVFLADSSAASQWQAEDPEQYELFSLAEALEIAARFFVPLL